MAISDFLSPNNSIIDVRISDNTALLKELCALAARLLNLETEAILAAMLKREELGSTGVGGGVAIPHARIDGVQQPFGIFARLAKPIEFSAVDDQPVDIVFMLLFPGTPSREQLTALASVARRLRDQKTVASIRKAPDQASLYRALTAGERN
jgi:PTS system nitrogen regulatory IIA component